MRDCPTVVFQYIEDGAGFIIGIDHQRKPVYKRFIGLLREKVARIGIEIEGDIIRILCGNQG